MYVIIFIIIGLRYCRAPVAMDSFSKQKGRPLKLFEFELKGFLQLISFQVEFCCPTVINSLGQI